MTNETLHPFDMFLDRTRPGWRERNKGSTEYNAMRMTWLEAEKCYTKPLNKDILTAWTEFQKCDYCHRSGPWSSCVHFRTLCYAIYDAKIEKLEQELAALRLLKGMDALEASAIGTFLKGADIPETIDRAKATLVRRMLEAEKRALPREPTEKMISDAADCLMKEKNHVTREEIINAYHAFLAEAQRLYETVSTDTLGTKDATLEEAIRRMTDIHAQYALRLLLPRIEKCEAAFTGGPIP